MSENITERKSPYASCCRHSDSEVGLLVKRFVLLSTPLFHKTPDNRLVLKNLSQCASIIFTPSLTFFQIRLLGAHALISEVLPSFFLRTSSSNAPFLRETCTQSRVSTCGQPFNHESWHLNGEDRLSLAVLSLAVA